MAVFDSKKQLHKFFNMDGLIKQLFNTVTTVAAGPGGATKQQVS